MGPPPSSKGEVDGHQKHCKCSASVDIVTGSFEYVESAPTS